MISSVTNPAATGAASTATEPPLKTQGRGMDSLGQGDFLKLLTVQMQQQDPFDPVDNKEMLAQMAQFSALAGTAKTNDTLSDMAAKLDDLITGSGSDETNATLERIADKLDQLIAKTDPAQSTTVDPAPQS